RTVPLPDLFVSPLLADHFDLRDAHAPAASGGSGTNPMSIRTPIYGLLAEFDNAQALVTATERAYEEGYRHMDAYSPFPVEGLAGALGFHKTRMPLLVLLGGILGGTGGYFMLYYTAVIDYPINVGARPLHSWPAFVPITFELTILVAALFAVLGMLAL